MYKMSDIIRDGDPILRKSANELTFPLTSEQLQVAHDMMEYLEISQDKDKNEKFNLRPGVGLAAPQVGKSWQMTAMLVPNDTKETEEKYLFKGVVINPKIVSESVQRLALEVGEGCLSKDIDTEGYVPRAQKITVDFFDENGEQHRMKLRNYLAIVFQHEIDHFHGKMYYDYINPIDPWHVDPATRYLGEEEPDNKKAD